MSINGERDDELTAARVADLERQVGAQHKTAERKVFQHAGTRHAGTRHERSARYSADSLMSRCSFCCAMPWALIEDFFQNITCPFTPWPRFATAASASSTQRGYSLQISAGRRSPSAPTSGAGHHRRIGGRRRPAIAVGIVVEASMLRRRSFGTTPHRR